MVKLKIFDVEHGQCALVEHGDEHVLIDCGHNSSTGWRPSEMLRYRGIDHLDALIITNADEDHASDLVNVVQTATIGLLYTNPTLDGDDILNLKGQGCGPGIRALVDILDTWSDAGPNQANPWLGGVRLRFFWNNYPHHFEDENNLSFVTLLSWPDLTICFPGDIEKAGWLRLLQDPNFRSAMADVDIFVASHHGRESGYLESLFTRTGMRPDLIIISDSGIEHATQETVARYGAKAGGIRFGDQLRKVLTTRCDGRIELVRGPDRWTITLGV